MACKIKIMLLSYSEGQCEVNKHSSLEPGCKVRVHFGCLNINYFKDYGGEWEIFIGPLIACKLARGFRLARSWRVHPPVCQFSNYLLSVLERVSASFLDTSSFMESQDHLSVLSS